MSAQPFEHTTTRLLIADKSENTAHELDSTLRDAGIATKLSISDDLAHIAQLVADGETDIANATPVTVISGQTVPEIDAQFTPPTPPVVAPAGGRPLGANAPPQLTTWAVPTKFTGHRDSDRESWFLQFQNVARVNRWTPNQGVF